MRPYGKFTPSQFAAAMTNGRGKDAGPGATALKLCRKIAMERMGVEPFELSLSALEWGNEWEPIARERYEKEKLIEVVPCFETIPHRDFSNVSGIPDGLVGDDGIIEIKCPHNPENHFANLYEGAQLDVYKWQGQGYCWITGRQWFEFVSFDPRFKEPYQMKVIRVERDEEMIKQLSERIALLEPIVESMLKEVGYVKS